MRLKNFKKKQIGIILIILGAFALIFIFVFLYFRVIKIPGFPELLPSKQTIGIFEFPAPSDEMLTKQFEENLQISWAKDISPWSGQKGAIVLLKNQEIYPIGLLQVTSIEKAFEFMRNYKNKDKKIKEIKINNITAFETPAINFSFISNILIASPSPKNLAEFLSAQNSLEKHLSTDRNFAKIRQNAVLPYFIYIKPKEIPALIYAELAKFLPQTPAYTLSFPEIGISFDKTEKTIQGTSYAAFENNILLDAEQAYMANLLKILPQDFEILISGQNLQSQLKKISALTEKVQELPKLSLVKKLLAESYFPGVDFEKEIEPLLAKEFAFAVEQKKVLFVTELANQTLMQNIEKLRAAFEKTAGYFSPVPKEVTLPDSSAAYELVPEPRKVNKFEEIFNGITIKGFSFNKDGLGVYDAVTQGKWFISNNLTMLKKSLLLTMEPGLNFRDSAIYKTSLQPIMKNPELLGVSVLPQGTFSFSKRSFADHMETDFVFVLP